MKKSSLNKALLVALSLGVAQLASALGLGPIQVNSYYGQPLKATIRVNGIKGGDLEKTIVRLAGNEAYQTRGITRMPSHDQLKFSLQKSGKGHVIHVSSLEGISDPFMNFLITVNNNGNVITREYSVFLDPDPIMGVSGGQVKAMPMAAAQKGAIKINPNPQEMMNADGASGAFNPQNIQGNQYVVAHGDTLYSIALALKPENANVPSMIRAIKRANPHAFYKGKLKANVTLTIPTQVGASLPKQNAPVADDSVVRAPKAKRTSKKTSTKKNTSQAYRPSNTQTPSDESSQGLDKNIGKVTGGVAPVVDLLTDDTNSANEAAERVKAEQAAKEAEERAKAEQAAKEMEEQTAASEESSTKDNAEAEAAKAEEERLAAEAKAEEERLAAEAKAEEERLAAEKAEEERRAEEARRKAQAEAAARAESERLAAEQAEAEKKQLIMLAGGGILGLLALGGLGYFLWQRKKKSEYSGGNDIEEISSEEMAELEKQFKAQDFNVDDSDDEVLTSINKARWDEKIDLGKNSSEELIYDEMEDDFGGAGRPQMDAEALFEEFEKGNLNLDELEFDDEPVKAKTVADDDIFGDMDFKDESDAVEIDFNNSTSTKEQDDDIFGDMDFTDPSSTQTASDDDIGIFSDDVDFETSSQPQDNDDDIFGDIDFSDPAETSVTVDDEVDLFTEDNTVGSLDFSVDSSPATEEISDTNLFVEDDAVNSLDFSVDSTPIAEETNDVSLLMSEPQESVLDFSLDNTAEFNLDKAADEISHKANELEISLTNEESADSGLNFSFDKSSALEETADEKVSSNDAATQAPKAVSKADEEAMEINLDLAQSLIATGSSERAKVWLQEVLDAGTEAQKALARELLDKIG